MNRQIHLFPHAALLMLSWGVFMFGAEYSWAYAPLLVLALMVAALGFLAARAKQRTPGTSPLVIGALCLLIGAALLQVVPLPKSVVQMVSPARDSADYAKLYADTAMHLPPTESDQARNDPRPISIEPSRTWLGLAFLCTFALLLLGSARGLHAVGPMGVARGIVIIGAIAAVAELMQKASGSGIIYGLWTPRRFNLPSAPFVNRNHTAGWLVMAMALAMGHFAGVLGRAMRDVESNWRSRTIWLSSREASEVVLSAFAIGAIAIAIVFTQSRSGTLCLLLAVGVIGGWALQRQSSRARRLVIMIQIVLVVGAAAVMGGADDVGRRFSASSLENVAIRVAVWSDTLRVVQDFRLTGTGLNTYGIAMLHYETVPGDGHFIEAHNDYLQVAAEGGLLLGIPAFLLVLAIGREIRQRFREAKDDMRTYWLRAGAVVGLVVIAFQSIFDFTLQMPGAAALFVTLLAIALHRPGPRFTKAQHASPIA